MAKLKLDSDFEIDLELTIGYQKHDVQIVIRIWKNGKAYLVPAEKSDWCDPEDYENYRLIEYEYLGSDDFFPMLENYVNDINKDSNKCSAGFESWPESRISINFSNKENSNSVKVNLTYDCSALEELVFKDFGHIDGEFEFLTDKQRVTSFYNDLKKEYENSKRPFKLFFSTKEMEEDGEEPWNNEKEIIKKQKYIESNNPIILIDSGLISRNYCNTQIDAFKTKILDLQKKYKVVIFGITEEEAKNKLESELLNGIADLIFLEDRCYPLNKELIYLRNDYSHSGISIFCCLDRYITSIWFDDWCKSNWNKAHEEIINCIEHPLNVTSLSEDDGTCAYLI